jgi:hypothetical protein
VRIFNLIAILFLTVLSAHTTAAKGLDISDMKRAVVVVETDVSQGSGVLLESSGIIVTNLHVIEDAADISIRIHTNERYDDVSVIDFDETKDIALLKIEGFDLPTVKLGNSNAVKSGQDVFAIGTPLGYEQTVSRGIVSAIRMMDGGFKTIQTDAAISPGSSGGGLFNDSAELIAVLAAYRTDGQNLNFAIPINYVRGMMGQPVKYSEAEFTKLSLQTPSFGAATARTSDLNKLVRWTQELSDEFEEFRVTTMGDDSFVVSIDELDIFIKLFDSLLWITMPFGDADDYTKAQLARLLRLSSSISYAYLSLDENDISVAYELDVSGSTYGAFRTGILAVIQGSITLSEDSIIGTSSTGSNTERKLGISKNNDSTGLRYVEPASLGIEIGFRAFFWDVEERLGGVGFAAKRGNRPRASVFVEQVVDFEITTTEGLEFVLSNYLESNDDVDELSIVSRGTRDVQSTSAAWAKYTGLLKGIKVYWYSTVLTFHGHLVTIHTRSGKPDWDSMEETTVEFLSNARLKL